MKTSSQISDLFEPILKQDPVLVEQVLKNLSPEEKKELSTTDFKNRNIAQDKYGCTPIFWAIKLANPEIVTILLEHGFSPLDENRDGSIAISAILEKRSEEIFQLCLQWFKKCLSRSLLDFHRDQKGSTFFHRLLEHEERNWIKELLPFISQPSLEIFDSEDFSPLHLAVRMGDTEIVGKIIGINPKLLGLSNASGLTPVHIACEYNRFDILQELESSLKDDFFKILNLADLAGNTNLHIAVESDAVEIIPFLLNNGASVFAINNSKESVFDIANREKHHHCLKILKKHILQHMKEVATIYDLNSSEFRTKLEFIQLRKILDKDELYQISPDLIMYKTDIL